MAGVSGGTDQLRGLRERLQRLGNGEIVRRGRSRLAAVALAETQQGFIESRAPDGTHWKPSNGFGGQTMEDTRRLRNSFSARPTASGFELGSNVKYAAQRQYGGTIRAKNGKYLRFKVPVSVKIASNRGGRWRRMNSGRKGISTQFVMVKEVTQTARPMVPEGQLGPIWGAAFREESQAIMEELLGR